MPEHWFQDWFNSPYYHILYRKHNSEEAELFINNVCNLLKPSANSRMLDIACGKGRHAIYLNSLGYDVTGIDLSFPNIAYAHEFENSRLHFFRHDMRNLMYVNHFNIAWNIFTSFGYFRTKREHVKSLVSFNKALKKEGVLVLDFFNSAYVRKHYKTHEIKTIGNMSFDIHKKIVDNKIIKEIQFFAEQQNFKFKEEVCLFSMEDFENLFKESGFRIQSIFGDYALTPFDVAHSERLIFICNKI